MKFEQPQDDSYPFLLRIWKEEVEGGGPAWAGRLQHIVRGNAHLFRTWAGLIDLLEADLQEAQGGGAIECKQRAEQQGIELSP